MTLSRVPLCHNSPLRAAALVLLARYRLPFFGSTSPCIFDSRLNDLRDINSLGGEGSFSVSFFLDTAFWVPWWDEKHFESKDTFGTLSTYEPYLQFPEVRGLAVPPPLARVQALETTTMAAFVLGTLNGVPGQGLTAVHTVRAGRCGRGGPAVDLSHCRVQQKSGREAARIAARPELRNGKSSSGGLSVCSVLRAECSATDEAPTEYRPDA